mmetsp:Transcript_6062/g.8824  ORF Transcript_6062/g.8824 Transcript_6062/m.8824 type:complete len:449 (+) Transcript_6062:54-1400(+)
MSNLSISKTTYKNIFCEVFKDDAVKYFDLRAKAGDPNGNNIVVNSKYFAIPYKGPGGPVAVINLEKPGRFGNVPMLEGHTAPVTDLAFSPFNAQLLASASGDGNICIWQIPEGGVTETIREPTQKLLGHEKKISKIRFHPSANNVLASSSFDKTIKLWDLEKQDAQVTLEVGELITDFAFNIDGSQMVVASKDKKLRIYDTRSGEVVATTEGFPGSKPVRVVWAKRHNKIIACGFGKMADARIRLYDPEKFEAPLQKDELDRESGNFLPVYDEDTGILVLARKGGSSLRYFELSESELMLTGAKKKFVVNSTMSGLAGAPKIANDTSNHEIIKLFQLSGEQVQPMSIRVPRKTTNFQEDIFPDTFHIKPAIEAEAFFGGETAAPLEVSMKPGERPEGSVVIASFKPTYEKKEREKPKEKTEADLLREENEQLKAKIVELEAKIKELSA